MHYLRLYFHRVLVKLQHDICHTSVSTALCLHIKKKTCSL